MAKCGQRRRTNLHIITSVGDGFRKSHQNLRESLLIQLCLQGPIDLQGATGVVAVRTGETHVEGGQGEPGEGAEAPGLATVAVRFTVVALETRLGRGAVPARLGLGEDPRHTADQTVQETRGSKENQALPRRGGCGRVDGTGAWNTGPDERGEGALLESSC